MPAILQTDALGNQTMTTFDNDGNPVIVQRTELGTITQPKQAPESFGTVNKFDCMDQLVFSAQNGPDNSISSQPGVNLARITFNGFDSRGNGVISLNANGNGVINSFDGASRPLSERKLMRQNGQGSNPPLSADNNTASFLVSGQGQFAGSILTSFEHDANGNRTALIDDRGGTTQFSFDTLDREFTKILHDGSMYYNVLDLAGDLVTSTGANGSKGHQHMGLHGYENRQRDHAGHRRWRHHWAGVPA